MNVSLNQKHTGKPRRSQAISDEASEFNFRRVLCKHKKRNVRRQVRTHAGLRLSRSHLNNPLLNKNQPILGLSNSIFTISSLMFMAVGSLAFTIYSSVSFTKGMLLTLELLGVLNIKLLREKKNVLFHSVNPFFEKLLYFVFVVIAFRRRRRNESGELTYVKTVSQN